MIDGDITRPDDCRHACDGVDFVLHQAALGSVPRSLENPVATNAANIDGFLNMLVAARDAKVARFVYAASSSTYGDHPALPKVEEHIGRPLSPYAVTKLVNELYAEVFARSYGFASIGLRYFNVFGKRQDPDGAYAAVIPKWIAALLGRPAGHDQRRRRDHARLLLRRQRRAGQPARRDDRRRGGDRPDLQRGRQRPHVAQRAVRQAEGPTSWRWRRGWPRTSRRIATSAPATCAIRRPTSARPRGCWATPPRTTSTPGLAAAMPWYLGQLAR